MRQEANKKEELQQPSIHTHIHRETHTNTQTAERQRRAH